MENTIREFTKTIQEARPIPPSDNIADTACVFSAGPILIGVKEKAFPLSLEQSSELSPHAFVHIPEILPEVFKEILEQAAHAKALPNAGGLTDRCAA